MPSRKSTVDRFVRQHKLFVDSVFDVVLKHSLSVRNDFQVYLQDIPGKNGNNSLVNECKLLLTNIRERRSSWDYNPSLLRKKQIYDSLNLENPFIVIKRRLEKYGIIVQLPFDPNTILQDVSNTKISIYITSQFFERRTKGIPCSCSSKLILLPPVLGLFLYQAIWKEHIPRDVVSIINNFVTF